MLQHSRPVKAFLTRSISAYYSANRFLHLVLRLLLRENLHPSIRFRNREWEAGSKASVFLVCLWWNCSDNPVVASETARVSALRQLDYSQSAARIRDPAAGPRRHGLPNPPGFWPLDQV